MQVAVYLGYELFRDNELLFPLIIKLYRIQEGREKKKKHNTIILIIVLFSKECF